MICAISTVGKVVPQNQSARCVQAAVVSEAFKDDYTDHCDYGNNVFRMKIRHSYLRLDQPLLDPGDH